LFNCVTEIIKVTDGRKYFPLGPHVGQPWSTTFSLSSFGSWRWR